MSSVFWPPQNLVNILVLCHYVHYHWFLSRNSLGLRELPLKNVSPSCVIIKFKVSSNTSRESIFWGMNQPHKFEVSSLLAAKAAPACKRGAESYPALLPKLTSYYLMENYFISIEEKWVKTVLKCSPYPQTRRGDVVLRTHFTSLLIKFNFLLQR